MRTLHCFVFVCLLLLSARATAEPTGNCVGTPNAAIVDLPPPLSTWGHIDCTPYGYVITANKGWLWTYPTAYAPVFIPSQMVKTDPKLLGNKMYFSVMHFGRASTGQTKEALLALHKGWETVRLDEKGLVTYRLFLQSVSGDSLTVYFFDNPGKHSTWGIWCPEQCNPDSRFMILDMHNQPVSGLHNDNTK